MAISIEHTSDGDKLRRDDGKLVGSLGKGKDDLPTVNPISKENGSPSSEEILSALPYAKQHEKLNLRVDPKKIATIEELTSYILADMSWLPDSDSDKEWIWSSKEKLSAKITQWANIPEGFNEFYSSPDEAFRYEENPLLATTQELSRALCKLGYEHYLAQPLPVFVFGTLRPGQGNFSVLKSYGAIEAMSEAKVTGVAMVAGSHSFFPKSIEMDKEDGVTDPSSYSMAGDIVYLKQDYSGLETRRDMDRLEGFRSSNPSGSMYRRVARKVELKKADGSVEEVLAWMYVTQDRSRVDEKDIVQNGDWFDIPNSNFRPERRKSALLPENWTFPKVWGEEEEEEAKLQSELAKEIEEYGEPLSNFK